MIIQGRIVNETREFDGWIEIDSASGLIERVRETNRQRSDAIAFPSSHLIFPGFIDLHVHAREDETGESHKESYGTVANAALAGGVTHICPMPNTASPLTTKEQLTWHRERVRTLPVGFTHYVGIGPETRPLVERVPYKVFTGPSVGELFFTWPDELRTALSRYADANVSFHVEDFHALQRHASGRSHHDRRPAAVVETALGYVLEMIEEFNLEAKLCHWPIGGESIRTIEAHRARGFDTTVEVSPLYLFFDTSNLAETRWPFVQANPSIQRREDRLAIIEALRTGVFDYLATDHAPHLLTEKLKQFGTEEMGPETHYEWLIQNDPEEAVRRSCRDGTSGTPQLDTYALFAPWLMRNFGFTPMDIARVCAANPGRWIDGLESRDRFYGDIASGFAGNLTVVDLSTSTTVRREQIRSRCGWSPYENVRFPGSLVATIVEGQVAYCR